MNVSPQGGRLSLTSGVRRRWPRYRTYKRRWWGKQPPSSLLSRASQPTPFSRTFAMTPSLSTRLISRASKRVLQYNASCSAVGSFRHRQFANIADEVALPLKGYKVLDMTRVLAGVSLLRPLKLCGYSFCFIAILHSNTGRPRVSLCLDNSTGNRVLTV